jgi:hypothetical protein
MTGLGAAKVNNTKGFCFSIGGVVGAAAQSTRVENARCGTFPGFFSAIGAIRRAIRERYT